MSNGSRPKLYKVRRLLADGSYRWWTGEEWVKSQMDGMPYRLDEAIMERPRARDHMTHEDVVSHTVVEA